ncbi:MAG: hypothetical protein ACRERD_29375 [Candidatus Binatia bacterium]
MSRLWRHICSLWFSLTGLSPALATEELQQLLDRLLAPPTIQTEASFSATMLVPPGSLYDPFDLSAQGQTLWVSDDGKEEGDKGGSIVAVDATGKVSVVVGLGAILPPVALDVAPPSFGAFAGHIFTVAFARPEAEAGFLVPNVIQRIDPTQKSVTDVCSLPENKAGQSGGGGFFLRFGPEGSPFAGKLFITAATNHTLYQVTPDGVCAPFITIDRQRWGYPTGMTFSPDGQTMLVGATLPAAAGNPAGTPKSKGGSIVRVSPDGTVADAPFVTGLDQPCGMIFAPEGFGTYGGQLFVADSGDFNSPVPMTQNVKHDGRLYRVTAKGGLTLVASGFLNPTGVAVIGNRLLVSDINGDFHVGLRELPDGFIVAIVVE